MTVADPYLGLQVVTAVVYAATIKLGGETGASPMSPGMKKVFTYMPFIAVPLTMGIPAATCLYFATNSVLSVTQTLMLRSPTARRILGLHPIVKPAVDPSVDNMSALDTLKQTFQRPRIELKRLLKRVKERLRLELRQTVLLPTRKSLLVSHLLFNNKTRARQLRRAMFLEDNLRLTGLGKVLVN